MLKTTGAGLIFLASILTAFQMLLEKRKKIALFESIQSSLSFLRREIEERMAPLSECFAFLAENEACDATRCFFRLIIEQMDTLGEREFSKIWKEAVVCKLKLSDDRDRETLFGVGQAVAGSDLPAVCGSLNAAAQYFTDRIRQEEDKQRDFRRMVFSVTLSLGAFAIIILI